jgi:predicted RNase H-like HicB family nuclease
MPKKKTRYTVSDGELVLVLEPAEEGGYVVTSPLDPELITQGDTLEEAFEMAYDAAALLREVRRDLRQSGTPRPAARRGRTRKAPRSAAPRG